MNGMMRGPLGWAWSWGLGWHRPARVTLLDAAFKVIGTGLLILVMTWLTIFFIRVAGPRRAADGWWWDLWVVLVMLFGVAVAWWTPRNPGAFHAWRKRRARSKRASKTARGRPPLAGTVALRERMDNDLSQGGLASPSTYMDFLTAREAGIRRTTAQHIVRREMLRRA